MSGPWFPASRVDWTRHADALRTQIQETGRVRLSFLSLQDLTAAMDDLGIDRADVRFNGGYAIVNPDREHADSHPQAEQ